MTESKAIMAFPRQSSLALRALLAILLLPAAAAAQDRSLHWRAMEVEAHLDRAGMLRVKETQAMVFTGEWNGGERRFDLRPGQGFTLDRFVRIDSASGQDVSMIDGDLSLVDGYEWGESRTLRWRSRLPGAPPFVDNERRYRLEYSYENILVPEEERYRLDHDFAFADRAGVIEAFTLVLTLDDAWNAPAGFTGRFGPVQLEPGEGFVVDIPLQYAAAGRPSSVVYGADFAPRAALAGALVVALILLVAAFVRREQALGRFAAADPPEAVTGDWLERVVLGHRPEVVGAAWDEQTGAAEVTAILARLEGERKLKSRVDTRKIWLFKHHVLHLQLLADRQSLRDYERSLVNALFFSGRSKVDTDAIREHYSKEGFSPADSIRGSLKSVVEQMTPNDAAPTKPSWQLTALPVVAALALLAVGGVQRPTDQGVAAVGALITLGVYLASLTQAAVWRARVDNAAAHATRFLIPMAGAAAALVFVLLTGRYRTGILVLAGLVLLFLGAAHSILNTATWRYGPARLRLRRDLTAARRHFVEELKTPSPRLRDEWFPYLIAFGLGGRMDKWFEAFGAVTGSAARASTWGAASASGSGSSGNSGSWSGLGGGGGFAGGGSSGAWVAAASSVAAGVSKPSSSSSGGGSSGGGGGSSSGGGGGGGW